jgi:hypothetical protein
MSYRQSLYPPPNSDNSQALQQLVDKQRQVELYHNILNHSQTLLDNYTRLYENYNLLVGGSEGMSCLVFVRRALTSRPLDPKFNPPLSPLSLSEQLSET